MANLPTPPPPPKAPTHGWLERWGMGLAVLAFLVSITITFILWRYASQLLRQDYWQDLVIESEEVSTEINNRLRQYQGVLRGTRGFFAGSERVERAEWRVFVNSLDSDESPATASALMFVAAVPDASREAFLRSVRQDLSDPEMSSGTIDGFAITPEGLRGVSYVPVFFEPFDEENLKAFGLDLGANIERLRSLELARDSGEMILTQKIPSFTTGKPSFALIHPIYRGTPKTTEERMSALSGFALALFEVDKFFVGTKREQGGRPINFLVFDTPTNPSDETLLYSSQPDITNIQHIPANFLRFETVLPLAGGGWKIVYFQEPPTQPVNLEDFVPSLILLSGTALSTTLLVLLAAVSISNTTVQEREKRLARKLTTSEAQFANVFLSSSDPLFHTDQSGKILLANPALERILQVSSESLINRSALDFFAEPDQFQFLLAKLERGEAVLGETLLLRTHNGAVIEFRANAYPLGRTAGNLREIEWVLKEI